MCNPIAAAKNLVKDAVHYVLPGTKPSSPLQTSFDDTVLPKTINPIDVTPEAEIKSGIGSLLHNLNKKESSIESVKVEPNPGEHSVGMSVKYGNLFYADKNLKPTENYKNSAATVEYCIRKNATGFEVSEEINYREGHYLNSAGKSIVRIDNSWQVDQNGKIISEDSLITVDKNGNKDLEISNRCSNELLSVINKMLATEAGRYEDFQFDVKTPQGDMLFSAPAENLLKSTIPIPEEEGLGNYSLKATIKPQK